MEVREIEDGARQLLGRREELDDILISDAWPSKVSRAAMHHGFDLRGRAELHD